MFHSPLFPYFHITPVSPVIVLAVAAVHIAGTAAGDGVGARPAEQGVVAAVAVTPRGNRRRRALRNRAAELSAEIKSFLEREANLVAEIKTLRQRETELSAEIESQRQNETQRSLEISNLRQRESELSAEIQRMRQQESERSEEIKRLRQCESDLSAEAQGLRERESGSAAEMKSLRQRETELAAEVQDLRKHETDLIAEVKKLGLRADVSRGESLTIIGLVGDERKIPFSHLSVLPGVKEAHMIETPYKLISREYSEAFQDRAEPDPKATEIGRFAWV